MTEQPSTPYGRLPPESEQLTLVAESTKRIQSFDFYMSRKFDENDIEAGLSLATQMLEDMKTSSLTPIHYNELYQLTLSSLSRLATLFADPTLFPATQIASLYETLQYTPSIVPRLYLLFTLAPSFISHSLASASDVMRDLIELARGVQHPTRALFLRHYLLHSLKSSLPESEASLKFILENFRQMNVLWVRLEFSLDSKTAEERKLQRSQLRQLVGSNIQRISSLKSLTPDVYREIVLPKLSEEVVACREPLSQSYIIESLTQAFPADYHQSTISSLFTLLSQVEEDVPVLALATGIIKRLQSSDLPKSPQTVNEIARHVDTLLQSSQSFQLEDTLEMLSNLLSFSLETDPSNFSNLNAILSFVESHFFTIYENKRIDDEKVSRRLRFFLSNLFRSLNSPDQVILLESFNTLVNKLMYKDRKLIALEVCKSFSRTESPIDTPDKLKSFFTVCQVLLKKPADFTEDSESSPISELNEIGRVFHLIKSDKIENTFSLIQSVSTTIQQLECEPLLLPLGQCLMRIATEASSIESQVTVRSVLQSIYTLLQGFEESKSAFWIFLESSEISDRWGTEAITTEFFISAFRMWKATMVEASVKFRMLIGMIRTATSLKRLSRERYYSIASELCASASGLLQKDQQAEAHLLCAHLFGEEREEEEEDEGGNEDKIKNCFVRALKAVASMMDVKDQLPWFYKVLENAIYFMEKGVEIPMDWFNALTSKIDQEHESLGSPIEGKLSKASISFYFNVIRHKQKVIKFE